ncbi:aspartyl protease family protein 2-like [Olea europaea var. sylvestris]|uniref:aspartyl protease family protein 2-like n=1 Tax=Olea europaea var. sylvestris TaxID=158386 RepID=UPI000C1CF5E2|nr:aspartyl protease family protein 2-like [Olea europaea var. sylvestris]
MDSKEKSISLLIFLSLMSISTSLQYQTLVIHFLPMPQSLNWTIQKEARIIPTTESEAETTLLSVDLHHVDNLSPSALSSTPEALFNLRLERDSVRVSMLSNMVARGGRHARPRKEGDFSSPVTSGFAQGSGEYLARIGIGTPARYFSMVLDTGSDVSWVQCAPCQKCYNQTDPIFISSKSKSFASVACGSPLCRLLYSPSCSTRKKCQYEVNYGDGSFTIGELAIETLRFARSHVNNFALGCGHDNEGLFMGASGLLGLGRGKLSFPIQTGHRFGGKFSYCLVDRFASSNPSWIIFGPSSISRNVVFTPMLTNPILGSFYYVGLNGISVGGVRVPGITSSLFRLNRSGNGGVIIDSGTSVTRLVLPAYIALRDAFRAGASNLKSAQNLLLFDTCYNFTGKSEVMVPTVVLHFTNVDILLPASNYLIPVDSKGRFCFAFAGTSDGFSIIGNIQQQGFEVVFDLETSRVGFAPHGCA